MTARARDLQPHASAAGQQWRAQKHRFELRGDSYALRLVQFPAGWLASVDTVEGPTLGCDPSPYLAVSRAVEPIGGGLIDAMSIISALHPSDQILATLQGSLTAQRPRPPYLDIGPTLRPSGPRLSSGGDRRG